MKFRVRSSHCPFPGEIHGQTHATLGYAIVIIDILLAPFTPSTPRVPGVRFFRSLKTCRRCLIIPQRSVRASYWRLFDVDDGISTSLSSSMFVTGAAPNVLVWSSSAKLPVSRLAGCSGSSLPAGWGYLAYHCAVAFLRAVKPEITHSEEVATWAGDELKTWVR